MTIAFRSSASVTNGTAGTSVTVNTPPGTASTDVLVAFIAEAGTGSITKPAGWNLIGSQAASTNITVAAYWRTGAGPAGSATWTLGASVRNWGWVGAYTGTDPTNPIAASNSSAVTAAATVFDTPLVSLPAFGLALYAVGATRAAGGSATTWTPLSSDERADLSTNAGAGTDIAGTVGDFAWPLASASSGFDEFTASQSQSQAALWAVTLNPLFVAYDPTQPLGAIVEAAFGADPDSDPATWSWTDVTDYVRAPHDISITKGRTDWAGPASATEIRLVLRNPDGRFTPGLATSPNFPNVVRNTPVRVSVPFGFAPPVERGVAFVRSWQPSWDSTVNNPLVSVVAKGRTARSRAGGGGLRSPLYRSMSGTARGAVAIAPTAYWPCEDESGATTAASAIQGVNPMQAANVSFAAESTLGGSLPLPTMSDSGAGAALVGTMPTYAATGQWCALFAMKIPTPVAGTTFPFAVTTTGTAPLWAMAITPGAPDSVGIRAYDSAGTQILSGDVGVDEAKFYGAWHLFSIGVKQNGADIGWDLDVWDPGSGFGLTGTLAARTHGNALAVRAAANSWTTGSGVGHFAVYTSAAFDNGLDPQWLAAALNGNVGEGAYARFARLCTEEGIEYASDTQVIAGVLDTDIGLGPQPVSSVAAALQECAEADHGLIHDGGPAGALTFSMRHSRYNVRPTLTLDNRLNQVDVDFAPVYDDQAIVNDVTVQRSGGSSARFVDTANEVAEGNYPDPVTLNLADDSHLYEMAGWRAGIGTTPGMRYPNVTIDLHANPALVQSWLSCRIGSRLAATNLPAQHPPEGADVFIEGYTETIGGNTWRAEANCSPARPYDVFALNGTGNTGRLDSGASTLNGGASIGATSLSVATTTGNPLWPTGAVSFDIEVSGIRVSVTNISGASSPQTFTVTGSTVTKALPNGVAVELWHPYVMAL